MQNQLVVCLGLVLSLVYAQTGHQFQASFSSYNDPLVLGTMLGTVNYDNTKHLLRYDYQVNGGIVSEYFDFVKKLRYLKCTTCDAETYTNPEPIFYTDGAAVQGAAITIGGQTCTPYTIADTNNPIATVYATAAGLPCRAVYRATPKTIDFSNWQAVDPNALTAIAGWGCPAQQCNKMIDFMLIFDESGSIVPSDFTREVQFGSSIASNYVFGPQNIGMGLVQFASTARTTIPLQFNQQSFLNAMNLVYQIGGGTNMGSGFTNAMNEVNNHGRPNVAKIFTILTDGQNNINVNQFPNIMNSVRAAGITVFSIGVGAAVDSNQITSMATVIPGVTTSFPQVPSFSALAGIVNNLVISTCINIPGNPCGQGCQGFCSCKGTCACPSSCDDNNKCTDDACDPNRGFSCQHTPHACSDGNFCTQDKCDPVNGCYFPTLVCNSPDACHNASCDPAIGCQYPPVNCDNGNPCFAPSCNPQAGCQYTPVNCDKCKFPTPVVCPAIPCFVNQCNVTDGVCQATPLNCDDGNACTDDSCDTGTGKCVHQLKSCSNGNLCNHNLCDVKTGCYWLPYNVSVDCDDGSNCTIDTCDVKKGCVHTPIVCDDGNNCTSNNCSYLSGCFFPPLNCLANPRIAKLLGTCYQALCSNEKGGCFLDQLPGTTVDSCGVCNGKNECVIVPLPSNVPYVIGGALLAVIIIGSIIVFAALAAFGGKKGYDIWLAHRNNMSGASTNPLYDAKGLSGTNPMYNAK